MDSDSQPDKPPQGGQSDKPPQGSSLGFNNFIGMFIAFVTLMTPIISIVFFSTPFTGYDPLASSSTNTPLSSFSSDTLVAEE